MHQMGCTQAMYGSDCACFFGVNVRVGCAAFSLAAGVPLGRSGGPLGCSFVLQDDCRWGACWLACSLPVFVVLCDLQ